MLTPAIRASFDIIALGARGTAGVRRPLAAILVTGKGAAIASRV
jgi:hypothetical protein